MRVLFMCAAQGYDESPLRASVRRSSARALPRVIRRMTPAMVMSPPTSEEIEGISPSQRKAIRSARIGDRFSVLVTRETSAFERAYDQSTYPIGGRKYAQVHNGKGRPDGRLLHLDDQPGEKDEHKERACPDRERGELQARVARQVGLLEHEEDALPEGGEHDEERRRLEAQTVPRAQGDEGHAAERDGDPDPSERGKTARAERSPQGASRRRAPRR